MNRPEDRTYNVAVTYRGVTVVEQVQADSHVTAYENAVALIIDREPKITAAHVRYVNSWCLS